MNSHDDGWVLEFRPVRNPAGETGAALWNDDKQLAAPLFDHPDLPAGYRYLDVFHLAHAAVLHWSPNTRAYLAAASPALLPDQCDDPSFEVAISLVTFAHSSFRFPELAEFDVIDPELITQIQSLTASKLPQFAASDWERAVSCGISVWDCLMRGGSRVCLDLRSRQLLPQK